jgi:hypothetical protein
LDSAEGLGLGSCPVLVTLRVLPPLLAGNIVILRREESVIKAQLAAVNDLLTE